MKWLWRIGVVLLALFALQTFVLSTFVVANISMSPNFRDGDIVLVSKIASTERGDIVVVDGKQGLFTTGDVQYVIKRVIAVGGDRIACCDSTGKLLLNGKALHEPYINGKPSTISFDITLPEGSLWLMGDNRAKSMDSRDLLGLPGGGAVLEKHVVGEVMWVLWRK
ncbi:MAG: signal peptidase [Actinomycetota bacterium]|jgi:signal peptidase I